jgi:hypothetical protein
MHSITRGFMGRGEEVKKVRGLACTLLYVACVQVICIYILREGTRDPTPNHNYSLFCL